MTNPSPSHTTTFGSDCDVVTGAFGYSGAAIAASLRTRGRQVRTLTNHPERAPADTEIVVRSLDFDDPAELTASLRGAHTLYNTYWVRFAHGRVDHAAAVANSRTLFQAAADAGVQRVVHVSITHASLESPYPYFRGKAQVEQILKDLGIPHAIARPAILFGDGGVLINNIAWLLRRVPIFAIGGRGDYRIRGIHVDDLAQLCTDLGNRTDTVTADAVGPERPTFRELVETIRTAVDSKALLVRLPAPLLTTTANLLGAVLRDRLLTADEYHAMADGLADSDAPATGTTRLTDWITRNRQDVGLHYANELGRHYRSTRWHPGARHDVQNRLRLPQVEPAATSPAEST